MVARFLLALLSLPPVGSFGGVYALEPSELSEQASTNDCSTSSSRPCDRDVGQCIQLARSLIGLDETRSSDEIDRDAGVAMMRQTLDRVSGGAKSRLRGELCQGLVERALHEPDSCHASEALRGCPKEVVESGEIEPVTLSKLEVIKAWEATIRTVETFDQAEEPTVAMLEAGDRAVATLEHERDHFLEAHASLPSGTNSDDALPVPFTVSIDVLKQTARDQRERFEQVHSPAPISSPEDTNEPLQGAELDSSQDDTLASNDTLVGADVGPHRALNLGLSITSGIVSASGASVLAVGQPRVTQSYKRIAAPRDNGDVDPCAASDSTDSCINALYAALDLRSAGMVTLGVGVGGLSAGLVGLLRKDRSRRLARYSLAALSLPAIASGAALAAWSNKQVNTALATCPSGEFAPEGDPLMCTVDNPDATHTIERELVNSTRAPTNVHAAGLAVLGLGAGMLTGSLIGLVVDKSGMSRGRRNVARAAHLSISPLFSARAGGVVIHSRF